MSRADVLFAGPAVGGQRTTRDGAEVDARGVVSPVVPMLWRTLPPIMPVEHRDLPGVDVGLGACQFQFGQRRVGITGFCGEVAAHFGDVTQRASIAVPPLHAGMVAAVAVLVVVWGLTVTNQADLGAFQ